MAENTLEFLRESLQTLASTGIQTWVFGGWAEELRGLCPPRPHKDIDLLYPAEDFSLLERFTKERGFEEIVPKRFVHKRAFLWNAVLVEFFLLQPTDTGFTTDFFSLYRFGWPADTLADHGPFPIASETALLLYQREHAKIEEAYRSYLAANGAVSARE